MAPQPSVARRIPPIAVLVRREAHGVVAAGYAGQFHAVLFWRKLKGAYRRAGGVEQVDDVGFAAVEPREDEVDITEVAGAAGLKLGDERVGVAGVEERRECPRQEAYAKTRDGVGGRAPAEFARVVGVDCPDSSADFDRVDDGTDAIGINGGQRDVEDEG